MTKVSIEFISLRVNFGQTMLCNCTISIILLLNYCVQNFKLQFEYLFVIWRKV